MTNNVKKKLRGSPAIVVITAVVILMMLSKNYFSFLEMQLFQERKNYIVEFTEKAAEIVDSVIEYSWQQVFACRHIMKSEKLESKEDLMTVLVSTSDFIDQSNSLALAIDKNANYYSSDLKTGRWQQTEMLTKKAGDMQQIVADVPHKSGLTYFICMERLKKPIKLQDGSSEITHLAIAVDIDIMREKISVRGFGDSCYTYLVNKDGRRLYKYTYTDNFIEGYNVLGAFRDVEILHGGTYKEFVMELKNGKNTALEFKFKNQNGEEKDWFVANSALTSQNWQVLLFVPTEVLGADSNMLLERTVHFFIMVFIVILVLVVIIILVVMIAKADKRLVQQKDKANKLLKIAAEEANSANQAKTDFCRI